MIYLLVGIEDANISHSWLAYAKTYSESIDHMPIQDLELDTQIWHEMAVQLAKNLGDRISTFLKPKANDPLLNVQRILSNWMESLMASHRNSLKMHQPSFQFFENIDESRERKMVSESSSSIDTATALAVVNCEELENLHADDMSVNNNNSNNTEINCNL